MYVCMYVCVHIYIYTYTHKHINIYIYIYIYISRGRTCSSLASRRGQDKFYVREHKCDKSCIFCKVSLKCAHFATNTIQLCHRQIPYILLYISYILPWTLIMGNCGTSVIIPFVLTPSGSRQVRRDVERWAVTCAGTRASGVVWVRLLPLRATTPRPWWPIPTYDLLTATPCAVSLLRTSELDKSIQTPGGFGTFKGMLRSR